MIIVKQTFLNVSMATVALFAVLGVSACSSSSSPSRSNTDSNDAVREPSQPDTSMPQTPDLPAARVVPAAAFPQTDSDGQVSWLFDASGEGLQLMVEPYVEMPLASNGQPARWNDLEFLAERLFVVDEQDGRVFEITGRDPVLWFDIKLAIQSATGRALSTENPFHGGVRGIAFHPDFASNGKFYASVMEQRPADASLHNYLSDDSGINADSVLVEWTANPGTSQIDLASYREVFRVGVPQYDHPIKQIAFNPAATPADADYGLLYVAHGDGSVESSTTGGGQANNALGKILRINPLATNDQPYSVPMDNPFTQDDTLPDEVYSYGHRNPHHLAFTGAGQLLAAEAGRDNIDEVNLVSKGGDYGWSMREGAYVHLAQGALHDGIAPLPDDDALNGLVYPVIQYGHSGEPGSTFSRQALGGGFVVENGSALDGQYFYLDFVRTGQLFHASLSDILQANTTGAPAGLTVAKPYRASLSYDHDSNPDTPSEPRTMPQIVFSASGFVNVDNRVDVRIAQGPRGELYLMSKRNNMVYLVSNSQP